MRGTASPKLNEETGCLRRLRLHSPSRLRSGPILDRGEVNTTIRNYETLYIVDTTLTDEQIDAIISKFSEVVTGQGGEIQAAGRWDKRRLAYEVKGRREGLYILMYFSGEPAVEKELDRVFRISEEVFRHIILRIEPKDVDVTRISAAAPAVETVEAPPAEAPAQEAAPEAPAEEAPAAEAEAPAVEAPAEEPASE